MTSVISNNLNLKYQRFASSEAEFKEFEPRFKFKPRLRYGWFHLKLYQMFQDLAGAQFKPGFGGFKPRL